MSSIGFSYLSKVWSSAPPRSADKDEHDEAPDKTNLSNSGLGPCKEDIWCKMGGVSLEALVTFAQAIIAYP